MFSLFAKKVFSIHILSHIVNLMKKSFFRNKFKIRGRWNQIGFSLFPIIKYPIFLQVFFFTKPDIRTTADSFSEY